VTRTRTHFFPRRPFVSASRLGRDVALVSPRPRRPRSVSSTWRPEAEPRRSSVRDKAKPRASRPPPLASTSTARWTSAPRLGTFRQTRSRSPQREAERPRATTDPTVRANPAIPRIARKYPGRGRPRRRRCVPVSPPALPPKPHARRVKRKALATVDCCAAVIHEVHSRLCDDDLLERVPSLQFFPPVPKTPLDCPLRTNT